MKKNFAFLDEMIPGIRWDAKYATWDNFTGKPVDGYMTIPDLPGLGLKLNMDFINEYDEKFD